MAAQTVAWCPLPRRRFEEIGVGVALAMGERGLDNRSGLQLQIGRENKKRGRLRAGATRAAETWGERVSTCCSIRWRSRAVLYLSLPTLESRPLSLAGGWDSRLGEGRWIGCLVRRSKSIDISNNLSRWEGRGGETETVRWGGRSLEGSGCYWRGNGRDTASL